MTEIIHAAFTARGIWQVGVCAFSACLPLLEVRVKSRLPANPQSVIVCALPYYTGDYPQRNVARYAICDDYHKAGGEILQDISQQLAQALPGYAFVPFIDVSPIREVHAAFLAGLGVVGLHGQLITEQWGGYVFIGCIVTDLDLPPSQPVGGGCDECQSCVLACPTGALSPGGLDVQRCRSYITQKKGGLTDWEAQQLRAGKMAWGCDICLDTCPHSKSAPTPLECLTRAPLPILTRDNLEAALKLKSYGYRGRAVLERNLKLID